MKTTKITIISVVIVFITAFSVYAEDDGSQFTSFAGFDLNTVTLAQIEQKYGQAPLLESGDAGEYVAKICYRLKDGILYFMSGEMGGGDHDLLGFKISTTVNNTDQCAQFPENQYPIKLNISGLHLGMTKDEFDNLITHDIKWSGDRANVHFASQRPMTESEIRNFPKDLQVSIKNGISQNYFDVGVSIYGLFSGGKLSDFGVWKVVTY